MGFSEHQNHHQPRKCIQRDQLGDDFQDAPSSPDDWRFRSRTPNLCALDSSKPPLDWRYSYPDREAEQNPKLVDFLRAPTVAFVW